MNKGRASVLYRVIITPAAESDLRAANRFIRSDTPNAARKWLSGIRRKISNLSRYPLRAPLAPEAVYFPDERYGAIRQVFYGFGNRGTYRILFVVLEKTMFVLHVRHGSRNPL